MGDKSGGAPSTSGPAAAVDTHTDPVVATRRMHYTFTGLHVCSVAVVQLLLFFRVAHMAFVLLTSTGFAFVVAGVFVGIMASNIDHLSAFVIGRGQARVITWTSVVTLIFVLLNLFQVVHLLTLPPLTSSTVGVLFSSKREAVPDEASVSLGMSVASVETVISYHLYEADRFILVILIVVFACMALLHVVTIIVYARISTRPVADAAPTAVNSSVYDMRQRAPATTSKYAPFAAVSNAPVPSTDPETGGPVSRWSQATGPRYNKSIAHGYPGNQ